MFAHDDFALVDLIPAPDRIRRRLAIVLTEAALLRSQLRVSERSARERDRLQRQLRASNQAESLDLLHNPA